jgi:hypothetical protein
MRPSEKGSRIAVRLTVLGLLCIAAPARAQILYEDAMHALGLTPDPLDRSARQVGLGRLSLVMPDHNNRLTMWDFAGNPTGVLDSDTTSTFELRPGTWSGSSAHDLGTSTGTIERQDFGARASDFAGEVWRRSNGATAFGGVVNLSNLHTDRPFDDTVERSASYGVPGGTVVLNGKMPYLYTNRMRYALRLGFQSESGQEYFRSIRTNRNAQIVDEQGEILGPRNIFEPDEHHVRSQDEGIAISAKFAEWLTAAVGADYLTHELRSENVGDRYDTHFEEDRPYSVGQASLVGRIGKSFEYAVDGRGWNVSSTRKYVSTASAGIGAIPISGRGDMLDRDEEGTTLRSRAMWTRGAWQLGASYGTWYRQIEITPPPVTLTTSFNSYLNTLFYDSRADSFALVDSVAHNLSQERAVQYGAGAAWRVLGGSTQVGVEYHYWRERLDQSTSGEGPKQEGWDVRGGVESPLTPRLQGRAGYIYRSEDGDAFTEQNEQTSQTLTAGLGLHPERSRWLLESGYAFTWGQADYGTPAIPRFTRQQLAVQIKWLF